MSESESEVTFVAGRAVEQTTGENSNLEPDVRESAKEAVRKAMAEAREKEEKETAALDREVQKAKPKKPAKEESDDEESPKPKPKQKPRAPESEPEDEDDEDSDEALTRKANDPHGTEKFKREQKRLAAKESEDDEEPGSNGRGPDGKFVSKTGKPAAQSEATEETDEEIDLKTASVSQILKNRQKIAALKAKASAATNEARAEATARQKAEYEASQAAQLFQDLKRREADLKAQEDTWKNLRQDPAAAMRKFGYDPRQFITDLAKEGTPEGQMERRLRAMEEQNNAFINWQKSQAEQSQKRQQEYQENQLRALRAESCRQFVAKGMDAEKYPHVKAFYTGNEKALVAFGDLTAEEIREITNGRDADYDEILQHIEDDLASKARTMYGNGGKSSTGKTSSSGEPSTQGKGKGKSLQDFDGELRKFSAKDLKELSEEDRLEYARRATKVAMAGRKTK